MTDEQVKEITARAEMEYEMLKDRVHDLYEENKQLKEDKKKARKYIKYNLKSFIYSKEYKDLLEILGEKEND